MTPESQRIAIAEACGWKIATGHYFKYLHRPGAESGVCCGLHRSNNEIYADVFNIGECGPEYVIPDYLNDLNAIHDAEETLNDLPEFCQHLAAVVFYPLTNAHESNKLWQGWWFVHATAAQRCEALLRTIGKWDDSK